MRYFTAKHNSLGYFLSAQLKDSTRMVLNIYTAHPDGVRTRERFTHVDSDTWHEILTRNHEIAEPAFKELLLMHLLRDTQ